MMPAVLLHQCAPRIAEVTMAAVVQQESGGNPLVLHDNTSGKSYRPATVPDAARIARDLTSAGHSVDIGLAQINSRNLPRLGLDVERVLDPCTNLHAAQSILLHGWKQSGGDLRATLSVYNTGKLHGAVGMAYGEKVFAMAGVVVPAIAGGKLASWAAGGAALPPVRPVLTWTPAASPLAPKGGGLEVALK